MQDENELLTITPLGLIQQLNASLEASIRCVTASTSSQHPDTESPFAEGGNDSSVFIILFIL